MTFCHNQILSTRINCAYSIDKTPHEKNNFFNLNIESGSLFFFEMTKVIAKEIICEISLLISTSIYFIIQIVGNKKINNLLES